ncbi:MAG TPA: methyltransferase domain-containing protein [Dongiaceae bacterium]|nr:methyltransferase domain-containing protein [Dongiaceae bacterium]
MISREYRLFLRRWLKNPGQIGAIAPSSARLANAMARQVPRGGSGPVIELGGGTGKITAGLLRAGIDPARLVVIERDPHLHRLLQQHYPKIRIVLGDAAELAKAVRPLGITQADAVVSGLPLLIFPREVQDAIGRGVFDLLKPGAPFIQFTYGPYSPVSRERLGITGKVASWVGINLPPASVWVYRRAVS